MEKDKRPTIAIMAGNAESEYFAKLVAGFRNCAKEEDVNLIFLMGPHIPRYCKDILSGSFAWDYDFQFHTVYDYVHFIKPDAIIVAYGSLSHFKHVPDVDEFVARFKGIPTLILGDYVEDPDVPHLIGGNYSGMRECIRHLVEDHGYKKIGFVGGPRRNYDSNRRIKAYKDVLTAHGIEVNEDMIVHGNYTEHVDTEVEYLLDHYPDIEAIAFANDNMAKAGYRVCAARDLVVGHDIAITGFDDGDLAKTLEPPLSSVAHSSFLFSYRAVHAALELAKGNKPKSEEMKAYFHKRESCGCKFALNETKKIGDIMELREHIAARAEIITDELFSTVPYEKDKSKYREWMGAFLDEVVAIVFEGKDADLDNETMHRNLKKMCQHPFVSKQIMLEYLEKVLFELIDCADEESKKMGLTALLRSVRQYVHSQEVNVLQQANVDAQRKMWFLPSFTVDLINANLDMKEQMFYIMNRLKAMGITSTYVYFYADGVSHKMDEAFELPETIYLNAYYNEDEMVYYKPKHRLPISTKSGDFMQFLQKDKARFYTAYVLFSGDEQYGLMLCEAEQKEFPFMLSCSMQLGSLRKIIDMNMRERQMQKELEDKNRILNELSKFDELTKLYNRRGFIEQALKLVRENKNKTACIVYADVDHLKEINDCFGHASGDFAIATAAEYLRQCTPRSAINARLGGDEFVSMFVLEEMQHSQEIVQAIKQYAQKFNAECNEAFYVEMSVGAYEFLCGDSLDIGAVQSKADEVLYEEKLRRRTSIKK
ncbi:MAG: diguanylate cyclase [Agathobacter sp.]|nr:diguanylate cyclase [Agathobacter sp.]